MKIELHELEALPSPRINCMGCSCDMELGLCERQSKNYTVCYVTAGQMLFNGHVVCEGQGFLVYPHMMENCCVEEGEKSACLWISSDDECMSSLFETYHADPDTLIFQYKYAFAVRGG